MSGDEIAGVPGASVTLFGDDIQPQFGVGPTEARVSAALRALHDATPLQPAQAVLAEICRALAQSIDRGNTKGRAIANEAQQLATLLGQLTGEDPGEEGANGLIPKQTKDLMDALATPPRSDTPTASDPAKL